MKGAVFLQPDLGDSLIVTALNYGGKRVERMNVFVVYLLCAGVSLNVHSNTKRGLETIFPLTDEEVQSSVCMWESHS